MFKFLLWVKKYIYTLLFFKFIEIYFSLHFNNRLRKHDSHTYFIFCNRVKKFKYLYSVEIKMLPNDFLQIN